MPAITDKTVDSKHSVTDLMRGIMFGGFVVISCIAVMTLFRAVEKDIARAADETRSNTCQTEPILWQFPYRQADSRSLRLVPDTGVAPHAATNCKPLVFTYLFDSVEPINSNSFLRSDWLYASDSKGRRDFAVHVEHVQPATSLADPTIASRPNAFSFAGRLQQARASFNGVTHPAEGFERFTPARRTPGADLYFLGKADAQPEFVGMCHFTGACQVLAFSGQDGFAFAATFSRSELHRLDAILQRTLTLLREWRV